MLRRRQRAEQQRLLARAASLEQRSAFQDGGAAGAAAVGGEQGALQQRERALVELAAKQSFSCASVYFIRILHTKQTGGRDNDFTAHG